MLKTLRALLPLVLCLPLVACPPPTPVCGNAKVESGEVCDDGNQESGDGCPGDCGADPEGPVCGDGVVEGAEACDDANQVAADGCENDCTSSPGASVCGNGNREGIEVCDDGNAKPGDGCENDCTPTQAATETCPGASRPAPAVGTCEVTTGDQGRLITGVVLTPGKVYLGGQVLFDSSGIIRCVGCDCSGTAGASTATQISCPKAVISPGLINSHDHITYQAAPYTTTSVERYEHRHDWRIGRDGHTRITNGGNATNDQIKWGELRQVMAGTTSVAGSGGQNGLLRNLDKANTSATGGNQEGLDIGAAGANYETFPLGDQSGTEVTTGCGYPSIDPPSVIPNDAAYLPHVAEGIEASARNEFLCVSSATGGGKNLLGARTAIIHGIGVKASDIGIIAGARSSLIWSPRSNVVLYGDTAPVPTYLKMGVNVALGTDWVRSGSMNLLRELRCADSLNTGYFSRALTDDGLWRLVTSGAADATKTSAKIGRLEVGKVADLALFRRSGTETFRSVLVAQPEDVVLTIRGGKVLYGDKPLVAALSTDSCDPISVCGAEKAACVSSEIGMSYPALAAANGSTYPLFFCGPPADEPSCVPQRAAAYVKNNSSSYSGVVSATDSDADGIPDATDLCPSVFNPIRPLDNGAQADGDGDGAGDVCDPCPLTANSQDCAPPDPNDTDGDGKANAEDNCPSDHNPTQTDTDSDGKGDACDSCPVPNPGSAACPTTIYAIKAPASPLVGQHVGLGNVLVTAAAPNGFFLQVHPSDTGYTSADYSGIFVYKSAHGLTAGNRIDVSDAVVADFFGQIELTVPVFTVLTSGNPLPAPISVTAAEIADNGPRAAKLEGVLVKVSNLTVANVAPAPGPGEAAPTNEFEVDSGLRVNDYLYLVTPFPAVGETFNSITGVADYRNGHFKLEPRFADDYVPGLPTLSGFGPSPSFIREGATGSTLPAPLSVAIGRVQTADTTVTVTSPSADLTVGNGGVVVIPAGSLSAPVTLSGVAQNAGVALSAALGAGAARTATVRVLGATESSSLVSLEPGALNVAPGASATFTVGLDLPASAPTVVNLAVSPATGFGTAPGTVTVDTDKLTAIFSFTADAAATGGGTLTAQLGTGAIQTANLTVQAGNTGLVINEIDYDQPSSDNMEFVEILNTSGAPVSLANLFLVFANGSNNTEYCVRTGTVPACRIALSSAAGDTLAAGAYLVVGANAVTVPTGVAKVTLTSISVIQNGHPDAVGIFDATQNKLLDSLGYGGAVSGVSLGSSTFDFLEGSNPSTARDVSSGPGSVSRKPNGFDSDDNSADFAFTTTPTPGAVNIP